MFPMNPLSLIILFLKIHVVADTVLREADEEQRLHLEKLMREAEQRRGSITVVSTEHEAGEQLIALTGIAALLRYPIHGTYQK